MFGSAGLTASLLELGLLDELRVMVFPILLGNGASTFSTLNGRVPLELWNTAESEDALAEMTSLGPRPDGRCSSSRAAFAGTKPSAPSTRGADLDVVLLRDDLLPLLRCEAPSDCARVLPPGVRIDLPTDGAPVVVNGEQAAAVRSEA
jgi:hypothetical protein